MSDIENVAQMITSNEEKIIIQFDGRDSFGKVVKTAAKLTRSQAIELIEMLEDAVFNNNSTIQSIVPDE